jgi:hypothetical protein
MNMTAAALVYDADVLDGKVAVLSIFLTSLAVLQIVATIVQMVASSSPPAAARLSLLTLGTHALTDAWLAFACFAGSTYAALFSPLQPVAFANFVLFAMFEMRLLFMSWRARHPELVAGGVARYGLAALSLYGRFYVAVFVAFAVVAWGGAGLVRLLLFAASSYWLPQVLHSAATDTRHGLLTPYVALMTAARLFPVLYLGLCPRGLLYALRATETRGAALASWSGDSAAAAAAAAAWAAAGGDPAEHPPWLLPTSAAPAFASVANVAQFWANARFALFLAAWQLALLAALLLQGRVGWGPRWFVPYVYLPRKYDYHRRVEVRDGRLVPAPADTAAWLRPAFSGPGGGGGGGAAGAAAAQLPLPYAAANSPISRAVAFLSEKLAAYVAFWTFVWVGLVQLARDGHAWAARRVGARGRRVGGAAAGGGGGAATGPKPWWWHLAETAGLAPQYEQLREGAAPDSARSGGSLAAAEEGNVAALDAAGAPAAQQDPESLRQVELAEVVGAEGEVADCVVCMDQLRFPMARGEYAATPCEHVFHAGCLMPWLAQKLECPTCRAILPEP